MTVAADKEYTGVLVQTGENIRAYEYIIDNFSNVTNQDSAGDFSTFDIFGDATLLLHHDRDGSTDSFVYELIGRTTTAQGGDNQEYTYYTSGSLTADAPTLAFVTGFASRQLRVKVTRTGSTDNVDGSFRIVQIVGQE